MAKREQKPVYINDDMFNGTYRRNWEGDYHCGKWEVLAMLRDEPETTMDMKVLGDMLLEDIDLEILYGYRNRHMACRAGHPWENFDYREMLIHLFGGQIGYSPAADVISVWEQQGWIEPEVEERYYPDRTILKLSLIKKSAVKISDNNQ